MNNKLRKICVTVKEKISMTLVEVGKADFIQGGSYHGNGVLQWGREVKLNFEYSTGKWGFIAKEKGGGEWIENYYKETLNITKREGDSGSTVLIGFLLKASWGDRMSLEGQWRGWGVLGEPYQISEWSDMKEEDSG